MVIVTSLKVYTFLIYEISGNEIYNEGRTDFFLKKV